MRHDDALRSSQLCKLEFVLQPQRILDQTEDFLRDETEQSEAPQPTDEDSEVARATALFDKTKTPEENLKDMPFRYLQPVRQIPKFTGGL